jgi:RNA-directed DNA polymerase
MTETPSSEEISTRLDRIAKLARQMPGVPLSTLAHHIGIKWMHEAYRRTRKSGSPGVDGQTAEEYAKNLEGNLQSLLDRAKAGHAYRAPPVLRVHIPKGDGKRTRPIGIPTFEDKVLQRAVAMVLGAVYEQDFLDCSYGFRPGRSAHQALEDLRHATMNMGGCWLIELDIESFFDTVDKGKLREMLRQRVRDGVLLRLVGKWLNAGVMEEGCVYHPDTGTPQGGVISPLLANIYLHEVLDLWFETVVKPRLKGRAHLVRFADDGVLVFAREDDARRVFDVLPKRFGKYGLRLHPEKTRLFEFRPPRRPSARGGDRGRRESFDFLGFTHFWSLSLKGNWVLKQKTAKSRVSRTLHSITRWLRKNRHAPLAWQHRLLVSKLRGHCAYFGIRGNSSALSSVCYWVLVLWQKWLGRRSHHARVNTMYMVRLTRTFPIPSPAQLCPSRLVANP